MVTALVPCASTGEIGDALNQALDQAEQALAGTISIHDGIASDVRLGDCVWKLKLLRERAANLVAMCDCIAAIDADPSLITDSREAA